MVHHRATKRPQLRSVEDCHNGATGKMDFATFYVSEAVKSKSELLLQQRGRTTQLRIFKTKRIVPLRLLCPSK